MQYPHGMARLAPVTTPGMGDRYLADKIYGFPAGPANIMAYTGDLTYDAARMASHYDHDFETATPYWYKVRLDDSDVEVQLTATPTAAYYRFRFPAAAHAHVALAMRNGDIVVSGPDAVSGAGAAGGRGGRGGDGGHDFFYAEFSKPVAGYRTWRGSNLSEDPRQSGGNVGFATDFAATAGEEIEVRVGLSHISEEQAKANLAREIPRWGFDAVKARARAAWNQALGTIAIKGGTERQRTVFYTALYRTLCRMTDITEGGRYYSGYDQQVHTADGHDFLRRRRPVGHLPQRASALAPH